MVRFGRVRSVVRCSCSMVVEAGCVLEILHGNARENDLRLSLRAQGVCQTSGNVTTNAGEMNVLRVGSNLLPVLGLTQWGCIDLLRAILAFAVRSAC